MALPSPAEPPRALQPMETPETPERRKASRAAWAETWETPDSVETEFYFIGDGEVFDGGMAPFICPLTQAPFADPVIAEDGRTYSRKAIEAWLERCEQEGGPCCSPLARTAMGSSLRPDVELARAMEQHWQGLLGSPERPRASPAADRDPDRLLAIDELNRIFASLDPLKDLLHQTLKKWQPPSIAVIGDESSGKSTILERLAMMPLLPRADDICTRLRIRLELRHAPRSAMPTMKVVDEDSGKTVQEAVVVPAEAGHMDVSKEMGRLVAEAGQGGICVSHVIVLRVEGPHLPSVDLVDLPGLVAVPETARVATRRAADAYVERQGAHSIFLAVVKASVPPNQSRAMQLIEAHGLRDRTLGVLTHCDLLVQRKATQRNMERLRACLSPQGQADDWGPGHGWVATMNAVPECEEGWNVTGGNLARLQQQAKEEVEFFRDEAQMQDLLNAGLAGTTSLVGSLASLFHSYLTKTWAASAIYRLSRELERLDYELALLGVPPALDGPDGRRALVAAVASLAGERLPGLRARLLSGVLQPLHGRVLECLPPQLEGSVADVRGRWRDAQAALRKVFTDTVQDAVGELQPGVREVLDFQDTAPPWPSVEAEALVAKPPLVVRNFPKLVDMAATGADYALEQWRRELAEDLDACIGELCRVASPWVRSVADLSVDPPGLSLAVDREAFLGEALRALLERLEALLAEELPAALAAAAGSSQGEGLLAESCAAERSALRRRRGDAERARAGVLAILGSEAGGVRGLAELEELSLARVACCGAGLRAAVPGLDAKFRVRLCDHAGAPLRRGLPAGHKLVASVRAEYGAELAAGSVSTSTSADELEVRYRLPRGSVGDGEALLLHVELHDCPVAGSPFEVVATNLGCLPPIALHIASPNGQEEFVGRYLLTEEAANGRPVWQQEGGKGWLYSGMGDGVWYVGGPEQRAIDFSCAAGYLASGFGELGTMPHEFAAGSWRRRLRSAKKVELAADPAITVTLPP